MNNSSVLLTPQLVARSVAIIESDVAEEDKLRPEFRFKFQKNVLKVNEGLEFCNPQNFQELLDAYRFTVVSAICQCASNEQLDRDLLHKAVKVGVMQELKWKATAGFLGVALIFQLIADAIANWL